MHPALLNASRCRWKSRVFALRVAGQRNRNGKAQEVVERVCRRFNAAMGLQSKAEMAGGPTGLGRWLCSRRHQDGYVLVGRAVSRWQTVTCVSLKEDRGTSSSRCVGGGEKNEEAAEIAGLASCRPVASGHFRPMSRYST